MILKKDKNFFDLMQTTFNLQYLTVSLPIYAIRNGKNLVVKKRINAFEFVMTMVLSVGQIGYQVAVQTTFKNVSLLNILIYITFIVNTLCNVATAFELKLKANRVKSVFDEIRSLDAIIKLEKRQLNNLKIKIFLWFSVIVFTIGVTTFAVALASDSPIYFQILVVVYCIRMYLQPVAILSQFFNLITLVHFYIDWINKQLQLIRAQTAASEKSSGCNPISTIRHPLTGLEDCKIAAKIEKIRQLYGRILDLKSDINEAFSLRLWVDTVSTILQILFFLYLNMLTLKKNKGSLDVHSSINFHFVLYWITFLTGKLLFNIRTCGEVAERGSKVAIMVHRIYSRSHCEDIKNELTTFSLELHHRDPRIKAYKFFYIEYSMAGSVVRGIIMQLIALMQFELEGDMDVKDVVNFFSDDTHPKEGKDFSTAFSTPRQFSFNSNTTSFPLD